MLEHPAQRAERRSTGGIRALLGRLDACTWASFAVGVVFLALTVAGALQVGTSWDESEHRRYGELVLDFYTSFGKDRAAATDVMSYYGGLHAVAGALAERLLPSLHWALARHLAVVAFGLVGFVYCVRLARLVGGSSAGLVATLLLVATPRWTGDAMYNPIDVPVAGLYAASIFYLARIASSLPRVALRDWIRFGAATGATLAVRTAGLLPLLAAIVVLASWALFVARPRLESLRTHGARILVGLALTAALAFVIACVFWPRLLVEPLTTLADSFQRTKSFPWQGTVLFQGDNVPALELPWTYLPVWFAITTPIATMLGLVFAALAHRRWLSGERTSFLRGGLVLFAVFFPPAYAVLSGSTIYDGIRHFLFVVPPMAVLAAAGWTSALRAAAARAGWLRNTVALALAVVLAEPALWTLRAHPFEYVYFNPLAGGLDEASHDYDSEYWGISLRSAAEWLSAYRVRELGAEHVALVGTNAPWHLLEPWFDPPTMFRYVDTSSVSDVKEKPFDVLLVHARFQAFRVKAPIQPVQSLVIDPGQEPFWQIYAPPHPGRPTDQDAARPR